MSPVDGLGQSRVIDTLSRAFLSISRVKGSVPVAVWLWNNTGRGLLPAVLVHTLYNVSWSLFPGSGSLYDPAVGGSILAVAAAIVTALWGPKTLARFRGFRA